MNLLSSILSALRVIRRGRVPASVSSPVVRETSDEQSPRAAERDEREVRILMSHWF